MSVLEEYLELVRAATAEIESLRQQLAESNVILQEAQALRSRLADLEAERALLVARVENAEAALVAEVAKNGRHAMRVTIAQLEARLQKVMARCADLLDEDQFNELDAIASSASGVQYKPCEICTTQSWCETHGCQCYPAEAMCCVDYPRCDCNSPPEPDNLPCGHPTSLLLMSAETGEALYCELCDDKSGRRDAEQCETELRAEVERLKTALKTVGDDYPGSSCQQWCYEAAGIRAPAEWPTREEAEKRAAELMTIGRDTLGENDDWLCFQRPAQPKVTP